MSNGPELPPPGWYQDPENLSGPKRWWDGSDWTDRRRMDGPQPPAPAEYSGPGFPPPSQPAGYPPGYGLADEFPSLDRAMSFGGRSLGANWLPLACIELLTRVIPAVGLQYVLAQALDGVTFHEDGSITGFDSSKLGTLAATLGVAAMLSMVGAAMGISIVLRFLDVRGEHASTSSTFGELGPALRNGFRRMLPLLGWYLVAVIAIWIPFMIFTVLTALVPFVGFLVLFMMLPVAVYVFVRLGFFGIAAVDGPGNPFSRSLRVSAGRFWPVFGTLFVAFIAIMLLTMILSFISGLAGPQLLEPVTSSSSITYVAHDSIVALVVQGFTSLLLGTFIAGFGGGVAALLYRSANPRPAA